jgi:hypothetical protein
MPTSDTVKNEVSAALGSSGKGLPSLLSNYTLILLSLPIAILVAIIFMLIIRCTANIFIYLLIFISIGALIAVGIYLIAVPSTAASTSSSPSSNTIIAACCCFAFALLILIAVCCVRKRLSLASSIIKVAAKFVS